MMSSVTSSGPNRPSVRPATAARSNLFGLNASLRRESVEGEKSNKSRNRSGSMYLAPKVSKILAERSHFFVVRTLTDPKNLAEKKWVCPLKKFCSKFHHFDNISPIRLLKKFRHFYWSKNEIKLWKSSSLQQF